jgi:hypothetical protein
MLVVPHRVLFARFVYARFVPLHPLISTIVRSFLSCLLSVLRFSRRFRESEMLQQFLVYTDSLLKPGCRYLQDASISRIT